MSIVRHITAWAGRTKYQATWFLLNSVQSYNQQKQQNPLSMPQAR